MKNTNTKHWESRKSFKHRIGQTALLKQSHQLLMTNASLLQLSTSAHTKMLWSQPLPRQTAPPSSQCIPQTVHHKAATGPAVLITLGSQLRSGNLSKRGWTHANTAAMLRTWDALEICSTCTQRVFSWVCALSPRNSDRSVERCKSWSVCEKRWRDSPHCAPSQTPKQ